MSQRIGLALMSGATLTLAALALCGAPARAQESVHRIVAVVNDDVISNADMNARTRLVLVGSGLPDTPENARRVLPQVLRSLIDERLQIQEAQRLGVSVTETDFGQQVALIEENNRMARGGIYQMLAQNRIPRATFDAQVRTSLVWQKLALRKLGSLLDVGNEEINEILARFRDPKGVTENLLAEIFLAVDSPDQEEEVRQNAERVVEQLRRGVPFFSLAQQFSQSASAAAGGDIGWVQQTDADDEVGSVITRMKPGELSPPIRTATGFSLYLLRERRTLSAPSPDQTLVQVAQLVLPLPPRPTAADIDAQSGLAETVRETVSGCADFSGVAKELGAPPVQQSPQVRVADLAPQVRQAVLELKVGEASKPVRIDPGIMLLMVCVRDDPAGSLPSRDNIADGLKRQRLDLLARRYLRDLRRAAVVDVRG